MACVLEESVEGFASCVAGMCSMKRAAEATETMEARVESEYHIFEAVVAGQFDVDDADQA